MREPVCVRAAWGDAELRGTWRLAFRAVALALEALGLRLASEESARSAGLALCFPAGSALCREPVLVLLFGTCWCGGRQPPCCQGPGEESGRLSGGQGAGTGLPVSTPCCPALPGSREGGVSPRQRCERCERCERVCSASCPDHSCGKRRQLGRSGLRPPVWPGGRAGRPEGGREGRGPEPALTPGRAPGHVLPPPKSGTAPWVVDRHSPTPPWPWPVVRKYRFVRNRKCRCVISPVWVYPEAGRELGFEGKGQWRCGLPGHIPDA